MKRGITMADTFNMRLKDILLYRKKSYRKTIDSFNDGTFKAEQLKRASAMAINNDRFNDYMDKYQRTGFALIIASAVHIALFIVALFTVDFILYGAVTIALAMTWYAIYEKKTVFAVMGGFTCLFGIIFNIAVLNMMSMLMVWGFLVLAFIAGLLPSVILLNREYIYLSKQEGFPHFKAILDEELEKNRKALESKIKRKYANITVPEEKKGKMDELEQITDPIVPLPDQKNDLMDSI